MGLGADGVGRSALGWDHSGTTWLTPCVTAVLAGVYIAHAVSHYADSAFGTTLVPLLNTFLSNASVSYNALNELLSEVPAVGEQLRPCTMQRPVRCRTVKLCSTAAAFELSVSAGEF